MRKLILLTLLTFASQVYAQQNIGTIKVKREQNLVKAVFDNTEYRLFAVDKYGNPSSNQIVSYTLWVQEKKGAKEFPGFSNELTGEMLKDLKKRKKATKIYFTNIKVKTDDDHLASLPDVIDVWFPDCKNCTDNKNR